MKDFMTDQEKKIWTEAYMKFSKEELIQKCIQAEEEFLKSFELFNKVLEMMAKDLRRKLFEIPQEKGDI